jgi:starch-binding outer membrane protein, SusD/RagB family
MKKLIIILSICILILNGCNDLDLFPLSEGSDANWFSDETELEMAVNNVFHQSFWRNFAPQDFYFNTDDLDRRDYVIDFLDGTITGETASIGSAWNACYKCIARANFVLSNYEKAAGEVPEEKLNMYAANAKFARATQYSKLIFHWGDVPYYEGTIDIAEAFTMGRTDKDEILPKIYADYDFAIEHLPVEYGSSEYQLATKGAALAFKARIALYVGDYAIARDAAKACIDLDAYQLFPDYSTLFADKTKNSVETIFAVPMSVELNVYWNPKSWLSRCVGGYGSVNPSWDLFCSYLCTDGLPIDESPLFDPHEPFRNRDPRCTSTIVEFNRNWLGVTYTPHPDSLQV